MPEERKEDADAGEEEGEEEIPSYIMPLFFTSKTQEIFGCKGDEDVTEENPHKLIPKEAVIRDFKDRAAVSDFHPAKKIVLVSSLPRSKTTLAASLCKYEMYKIRPSLSFKLIVYIFLMYRITKLTSFL